MPPVPRLIAALLCLSASSSPAQIMPMPTGPASSAPASSGPSTGGCARLRPGMSVAKVLALMGREPDSSLSGHGEPGPDGGPATTWTVDEWYSSDARGYHLTSRVRYLGATVESIECDQPLVFQALPPPPSL